ncbi:hypothetical protein RJ640_022281 [Escallonia rubra]|uniref:Protein N-terminal asparagine amidohydrolase n=1 Tax=Escallonia rubra TaxID=112253 RepID=A0AA88RF74_9ASTE|nr:hypothetical protein RJ640_022281 [Escallonia rubra]
MLGALMEHPILVSSSHSFRDIPEGKFSVQEESSLERSTESRSVYVFQREYATVDPALVEVKGLLSKELASTIDSKPYLLLLLFYRSFCLHMWIGGFLQVDAAVSVEGNSSSKPNNGGTDSEANRVSNLVNNVSEEKCYPNVGNKFSSNYDDQLVNVVFVSFYSRSLRPQSFFASHEKFVGTDEATTCVGIVVRNRRSGMTSVAHLDSPKVVDIGITQMLSLVLDRNSDCILDVHIVGAFEDASPQLGSSQSHVELGGYSLPLCTKIIETLEERGENFHIQTLHVLGHNTRWDSEGNAYPIFTGLLVETSTGSVNPARFDSTSRIPDEIVRRIRVCSSHEDPSWTGRLLETYDTQSDRFVIAPCCWTMRQFRIASTRRELSDPEILLSCSTSPSAEGPNFVDSIRRKCEYLIQHPVWTVTFPSKQPRVFERTSGGGWTRLE